ncbi:hypothetical protein AMAG_16874 [Allomyces macrogynus ATCC 38327]|uniref:endo-1,4-beta-xylanase n=1 Tax=Allomyces macrogynus (strain ATCC 38327) TaxID=578462 RepID=A0A0L0TCF1_ALLM3|nr:hypothetical protein AMAG_16874 [Allomyces macrogynus ATCC 38327]|eukprot:KNE72391.1 hypothetical protein AMAG_16874 [Allomyces macrogynus ATCC 38327]
MHSSTPFTVAAALFLAIATVVAALITPALAAPTTSVQTANAQAWKTISKNGSGYELGGLWYSFWADVPGHSSISVGPDGQYKTSWNSVSNFVAGKGWPTGSPTRVVEYSGTFSPQGNGYLSVYGWAKDWSVEYYITDNWGNYRRLYSPGLLHRTGFIGAPVVP